MSNNIDLWFFKPNRVWRCYQGGKLLDHLMGNKESCDGLFPENWLGSVTGANNGEHQTGPQEGLSRLTDDRLFRDCLRQMSRELTGLDSGELGILCKFLDSAVRLPLQCHPDREFACKHCHSQYGKTESWFILNTREIDGVKPYILLGFKPGIDREEFRRAVAKQDIGRMVEMFHRIEVKPGDCFFIPGRLPHAIGSGVLMLEVQEPTDLVVQPERYIGDIELSNFDMWQNLTVEQGLDCFDYTSYEPEELLRRFQVRPKSGPGKVETLIDNALTDCFQVERLCLQAGESTVYPKPDAWKLGIVTAGSGIIKADKSYQLQAGDCFFAPLSVDSLAIEAFDTLTLYWAGKATQNIR